MPKIFFCFLILHLINVDIRAQSQEDELLATWKLLEYQAFEKVLTSPQFAMLSPEQQKELEDLTTLLLNSIDYVFEANHQLEYKDYENGLIISRKAKWKLEGDILSIQ